MNDNHPSDSDMPTINNTTNNLDDLQYRRSIYADPTSRDDDIIEAQNTDPAKKKLAQDLYLFDEKLKQAMKVPDLMTYVTNYYYVKH